MKGCARSAILQLIGFLAAVAAVMIFLHRVHGFPLPKTIGVSLFAGLFTFIALGLLFGIAKPVRERASLRDCLSGRRPRDGASASITGVIDAVSRGATLRAPFSGTECVAYRYEIWDMRRIGRSTSKVVFFEGLALTPSVVTAPSGAFRLLAVPEFDFPTEQVQPGQALFHWREYEKTASFEGRSTAALEKQWTDDDGQYRRDKSSETASEFPIEACRFTEMIVRPGEKVCLSGLYSDRKGGIVPHPNWAHTTRVMKGDGDDVRRQLGRRIVKYTIGGIVSAGAAAGILAAFIANASR